jgi:hypothetical protein
MAMYNVNLLSNNNIPEDREEGEDSREGRCSIDDEKGDVVDFEAIRKISHSSPPVIRVGNYYDLVPSIDELRGQLVDVGFDSSRLGKEEVADHRNVIRHGGQLLASRANCKWSLTKEESYESLIQTNRTVSRSCCRCHSFV